MRKIVKSIEPKLRIGWCDYKAALYACKNWHYSKSIPVGKIAKFGIWEDNEFKGCILYSRGSSPQIGKMYKLDQTQICELTRIAMRDHYYPVSKYISITLKMIKKKYPTIELVLSFADTRENHHGGIYQASNWIYVGMNVTGGSWSYKIDGKWTHIRTLHARYGTASKYKLDEILKNVERRHDGALTKHKYLIPLKNREKYIHLAKPYPKRIEHESNA